MATQDPDAVAGLRELILAAEAYRMAASRSIGLNLTESQAVSYLLARGPLGQHELAAALGVTTGSVTPLVDRLERRGIVTRKPHPTDRRRNIVALTSSAQTNMSSFSGHLARSLPPAIDGDSTALVQLLEQLAAGLRAANFSSE